jgi:TetR/AcrR family transcriptional regulator, tetracycline repressor protein
MAITERAPLTRERIVATALELIDADGLDALSMRRLGSALGVEAMSLYHHVANKDDVLDGVLEQILLEVQLPPDEGTWQDQVRALVRAWRVVAERHPNAFALVDTQPIRSIEGFAPLETAFRILSDAGLKPATALDAFAVSARLVLACVREGPTTPETHDDDGPTIDQIQARYPNLGQAIEEHGENIDLDVQFEIAIEILVAGLERLVETDQKI